jgi:membrane protease YdiL (CAAX protease family)
MKVRALVELVLFYVSLAAAIWVRIGLDQQVVGIIMLLLAFSYDLFRQNRHTASLGSIHNPSSRVKAAVFCGMAMLVLVGLWMVGIKKDWVHEENLFQYFVLYTGSAALQQFVLLAFCYRRLAVLAGEVWAGVVASLMFAMFHLPNPTLFFGTLALALVTTVIYRRCRDLFVPTLMHWLLGASVALCLPYEYNYGMIIGYKLWRAWYA